MNDFKRYYLLLALPLKLLGCFYFAANQYLRSSADTLLGNGGFMLMNLITIILLGYIFYYVKHIGKNEHVQAKGLWTLALIFFFVPAYLVYWFKYISKEGKA